MPLRVIVNHVDAKMVSIVIGIFSPKSAFNAVSVSHEPNSATINTINIIRRIAFAESLT